MVQAQSPHVGTYTGRISIELSGAFSSGPTDAGLMIFNVFPDGTVAEIGGDPIGAVSDAGAIIWEQPNTFNFTSGTLTDGSIISESSTTENALTRTLRIKADLAGSAFPQGQTFTGQIVDLTPDNGYRSHNRVIHTGNRFIAVGDNGTVALSDDGLEWTRSAAPTARDLRSVAYGDGTYLIGGDNGVLLTSTDGINWLPRNSPFPSAGFVAVIGAAYGNGKFVIASALGGIATSSDGAVWTLEAASFSSPSGLTYKNGKFVHWTFTQARFSDDGVIWDAPVNPGVGNALVTVTYGNGVWAAAGNNGIATSPDGTTWTLAHSGFYRMLEAGAGRFVTRAVGSNGETIYSTGPDATAWLRGNALIGTASNDIAYGNGRFVMVGDTLQASDDGRTWRALRVGNRTNQSKNIRRFVSTDGSVDMLEVYGSGSLPSSGTMWVGPRGNLFLDTTNLKAKLDAQTDADLFASAGEFVGGAGGVIRAVGVTGPLDSQVATVYPVASPTTRTLRDGMRYGSSTVMVGDGGTIIRTTGIPSAATATLEASGTTRNLRYVETIFVNNSIQILIAVGDHGTLLSSPVNGGGWTVRETGTTANLVGVSYLAVGSNDPNGVYVAVGEDGTVVSSPDLVTWTERTPVLAPGKLTRYHAGTLTGERGFSAGSVTSADGPVFSGSPPNTGIPTSSITHGAGRFVTVGGTTSAASPNGRDWEVSAIPTSSFAVAYGKGRFVAVGGSVGQNQTDRIHHSPDGLTWQRPDQPTISRQLRAIAYGSGRFIASGEAGIIVSSENGADWTILNPSATSGGQSINAIVHHGNTFVAAGGQVISSIDGGLTWAARSTPGSTGFSSVTYGNGLFVAVGGNRIYRSANGIDFSNVVIPFSQSSTGSTPEFNQVVFANGVFIATTHSSQAYVSADAITWSERFTGVRTTFWDSVVANGLAVLIGNHGKIIGLAVADEGSPYVVQQPQDTEAIAGTAFTLAATSIGDGPLTFQWTRNGVPLADDARISGTSTLTLQINDAVAGDAGHYKLLVTNALGGRTSRAADVTVVTPPVITAHPQSITAAPDEEVVLGVAAEGALLSYQWFKNATLMPGETNASLVIASAATGGAGIYTVEITNPAGTLLSQPAAVSISSPPGGRLNLTLSTAFNANVPELRVTNVVLQFGSFPAFALRQLLVQPDGKVLVAGQFEYTGIGGQTRHSLMRLNADGTLDTTFTIPTLEIDGHNSARYAASIEQVALLSDGRIVLTGGSIQRIGGVLRSAIKSAMLNADGTLVPTFSPSFASSANPYSVAVDASNRILYAGNNITSSRHIRRFATTGSLDSGYSGASLGHAQAMNQSLVIQSDNKPVYSAYTTDFTGIRTHRTTTGGAIDATFQSADLEGPGLWVNSHTPLPDDAFLVNGAFTAVNGTPRTGVARFTANGGLDTTFAPDGEIGGTGSVHATAPVAGGFYVAGGQFTTPTASNLAALRADGSLLEAPAFGSGTNILVNSVAADAAGTIIYAGGNFSTLNGQPVPKVIRFDATATAGGDPLDLDIISLSPSRSFEDGELVVLTVAATGGNLTFQWFKEGDELPGETNMSLVLSNMTAADAGSYRVEVSDATGMVPSGDILLTHNTPHANSFANWSALLDLPDDQRGPGATPAGDDVANLIKFAIGVGPLESAAGRIPQEVAVGNVNDETYPVVCFVRDTTVTGVAMQVEVATNLDFTVDLGSTIVSTEDLGDGLERVRVRSNARFADMSKQFFRLIVFEN